MWGECSDVQEQTVDGEKEKVANDGFFKML